MGGPAVGPGQMLVLAPGQNTHRTRPHSPLTVLSQRDMLIIPVAQPVQKPTCKKGAGNGASCRGSLTARWHEHDSQDIAGTVQALVLWGPSLQCRLWRAAGRPCLRP